MEPKRFIRAMAAPCEPIFPCANLALVFVSRGSRAGWLPQRQAPRSTQSERRDLLTGAEQLTESWETGLSAPLSSFLRERSRVALSSDSSRTKPGGSISKVSGFRLSTDPVLGPLIKSSPWDGHSRPDPWAAAGMTVFNRREAFFRCLLGFSQRIWSDEQE